MAEHASLTDPNLHEPKGASTASDEYVMKATGAGATEWTPLLENSTIEYAHIYTQLSDGATVGSVGTTPALLPFDSNGVSNGATANATNDSITVSTDGVYHVTFCGSFSTVAAGDSGDYIFRVNVDGVPSILEAEIELSGTNDSTNVSVSGLLALTNTDEITVEVESDEAGNTDDLNILNASLLVVLVRAT